MIKRAFVLGLLLVATQVAAGCCWCNRPYLFRRCCWQPAGCGFGASCGCADSMPVATEYGAPPVVPGGTMPPATPLTRR
jgi:hypothetical protein